MNKKITLAGMGLLLIWLLSQCTTSQIVYSNVSVPEEGGIRFEKLTDETRDNVSGIYNPQIEMFARFKTKSSFHKTKRII